MALEERYENLRKSVNQAIKKLCNSIGDISKEVKELKSEILKFDEKECKNCTGIKIAKEVELKVELIEKRMTEISKDDDETKKIVDEINGKFVMNKDNEFCKEIENLKLNVANNELEINKLDMKINEIEIVEKQQMKLTVDINEGLPMNCVSGLQSENNENQEQV